MSIFQDQLIIPGLMFLTIIFFFPLYTKETIDHLNECMDAFMYGIYTTPLDGTTSNTRTIIPYANKYDDQFNKMSVNPPFTDWDNEEIIIIIKTITTELENKMTNQQKNNSEKILQIDSELNRLFSQIFPNVYVKDDDEKIVIVSHQNELQKFEQGVLSLINKQTTPDFLNCLMNANAPTIFYCKISDDTDSGTNVSRESFDESSDDESVNEKIIFKLVTNDVRSIFNTFTTIKSTYANNLSKKIIRKSNEQIIEMSENLYRQKKIDNLINAYVLEYTPNGNAIMRYNTDIETFEYWSSCYQSESYLETIAKKYTIQFNCKHLYVETKFEDAPKENDKSLGLPSDNDSYQAMEQYKSKNFIRPGQSASTGTGTNKSIPNIKPIHKREDQRIKIKSNKFLKIGDIRDINLGPKIDNSKSNTNNNKLSYSQFKLAQKK